jgi:hypothetical protein
LADVGSRRADTLILAMPTSGSGESESGAGLIRCSECGARVEPADRFCRSCGAGQPPALQPPAHEEETVQLTGALPEVEGEGLDPPTEESTRVEPPTERQSRAEETEALPPSPEPAVPAPKPFQPPPKPEPRSGGGGRRLIAIAIAISLGLLAGLIAVITINGRDSGPQAQATATDRTSATTLDPVESLRAHFDLLQQGRFISASDDLTPALLDSLGGKTIWISERIADLLVDAQLDATVIEESDSAATVQVNSLRTESLVNGCTRFTGTYQMVRSGDRWLIDSADLIDTPC